MIYFDEPSFSPYNFYYLEKRDIILFRNSYFDILQRKPVKQVIFCPVIDFKFNELN